MTDETDSLAPPRRRVPNESSLLASLRRRVSKGAHCLASLSPRAIKEKRSLASPSRRASKKTPFLAPLARRATEGPCSLASPRWRAAKETLFLAPLRRRVSKGLFSGANDRRVERMCARVDATHPRARPTFPAKARSLRDGRAGQPGVVCSKPASHPENLRERTYVTMATPTEKSIVADLAALVEGLEKNLPTEVRERNASSWTRTQTDRPYALRRFRYARKLPPPSSPQNAHI